jgi:hypothetical protein
MRWRQTQAAVGLAATFADEDAELEQLTPDALGAPGRILPRDPGDQFAGLGAPARVPGPDPRPPPPEQRPTAAVPTHDRVRRDQDQVAAPVAPNEAGQQPEQLVAGAQAWALARRARQDGQLLAQ